MLLAFLTSITSGLFIFLPPPTDWSTRSLSHPSRSLLHSGQIEEPGITEDYPARRIADRAQRAPAAASERPERTPFRKNPEGLTTVTHLANVTRKGIYFTGYARRDNQPLFRAALRLPHCRGTAATSPPF